MPDGLPLAGYPKPINIAAEAGHIQISSNIDIIVSPHKGLKGKMKATSALRLPPNPFLKERFSESLVDTSEIFVYAYVRTIAAPELGAP